MTGPDLPAKSGNDAVLSAVTPGGLPYPVSTDPANQGANAIKSLALALDVQYMEVNGPGGSIPSGAWTVLTMNTVVSANGVFVLANNSIQVVDAGRYIVEVYCWWLSGSANRRGVGFSNAVGTSPGAGQAVLVPPAGSSTTQMYATFTRTVPANGAFFCWVYQDSGAAINVSSNGLKVTKL